jgi:hypothetical protein
MAKQKQPPGEPNPAGKCAPSQLDINMPNYASAIVSTDEIVAAIAAP